MTAALLAPVAAFAQQAAPAPAPAVRQGPMHRFGRHRHGHHGFMMRGVNLNAQQKAQIKQIMQNFRQAHPRGTKMDPQARRTAHQQLRAQIMNVLTPQQRTQVQQNIQQMRQRRQEMRARRAAEPSPAPTQQP